MRKDSNASAFCWDCEQFMKEADGCTVTHYVFEDSEYERLPYGSSAENWWDFARETLPERCPDCYVKQVHYHHPGCDIERCPRCHGQYISCECPPEDED